MSQLASAPVVFIRDVERCDISPLFICNGVTEKLGKTGNSSEYYSGCTRYCYRPCHCLLPLFFFDTSTSCYAISASQQVPSLHGTCFLCFLIHVTATRFGQFMWTSRANSVIFLGAFTKLRKATFIFVISVCPYARPSVRPH